MWEPRRKTSFIFPVLGMAINKICICPWMLKGPGICYLGGGNVFGTQRQGVLGWRVCATPWKSGKVMSGVSDLGCNDFGSPGPETGNLR